MATVPLIDLVSDIRTHLSFLFFNLKLLISPALSISMYSCKGRADGLKEDGS